MKKGRTKRRKNLTIGERCFFGHGPQDLIDKLHHDFKRMQRNRYDWRPVFDFFTSAIHVRNWWKGYCLPDHGTIDPRAAYDEPSDPKTIAILAICDEVGNAAKHFLGGHEGVFAAKIDLEYGSPLATTQRQYLRGVFVIHLTDGARSVLGIEASMRWSLATSRRSA